MRGVEWFDVKENKDGIDCIAYIKENPKLHIYKTVGYNGMLNGDKVIFRGKEYYIVFTSRLGWFGLNEIDYLPYKVQACAKDVKLIRKCNKYEI